MKIHKKVNYCKSHSVCGIRVSDYYDYKTEWEGVTCKNCLKTRLKK